ncbi:hypothetical protein GQ53DRAFT_745129 [Thozetella sp. PMI_491]|nr:hypothetical protein GQ53DRAFT_745129 [Thozetella sp. PMI_491]
MSCVPLALASSLFSMAPAALPFEQTLPAFACVIVILSIILFFLVHIVDWSRIILKRHPNTALRWWDTLYFGLVASLRRPEAVVPDSEVGGQLPMHEL